MVEIPSIPILFKWNSGVNQLFANELAGNEMSRVRISCCCWLHQSNQKLVVARGLFDFDVAGKWSWHQLSWPPQAQKSTHIHHTTKPLRWRKIKLETEHWTLRSMVGMFRIHSFSYTPAAAAAISTIICHETNKDRYIQRRSADCRENKKERNEMLI